MATIQQRFAAIHNNPRGVRFRDLQRVVVAFGFQLKRVSGSHHIYQRPGVPEALNLQNVRGKAKPYQVRQFLTLVEKHHLKIS